MARRVRGVVLGSHVSDVAADRSDAAPLGVHYPGVAVSCMERSLRYMLQRCDKG